MNLKVEQYLALSSLAYQVIPNSLLDDVSKQTLKEITYSNLNPSPHSASSINNFQKRNNLKVVD